MQRIQTEVLVIGGGSTGTGVLRDLAMRGFKTLLVEKGDLSTGTTGRFHGLLHSGGRYVVKDPQAARECIQENHILRRIMPHCLEDTGGFFVLTPWDDPVYAQQFIQGCMQAQIPVDELPVRELLAAEPLLSPEISRCFHVPDAAADSFLASQCNAASAIEYGATCLTYHQVTGLLVQNHRVVGARLLDLVHGTEIEILADMTVNASGAWAAQICAMAGIPIVIIPGKGTMLALNQRILHSVVNRCKVPSDGDILVPIHTVTVIGTTEICVTDPDHFSIEPWEVQLLLEEGEKLIPGFKSLRILRAWAGVRSLFHEDQTGASRDISRSYVLLDHQTRDGLEGFATITSGKWTTYRRMAEVTVDLICQQLGVSRPCQTHQVPLPAIRKSGSHFAKVRPQRGSRKSPALSDRLAEIEANNGYGQLICECELATVDDIVRAIQGGAQSLDDIRRLTRLGMGPCQGGFCSYRAAGLLHQIRRSPVYAVNDAIRDFLLERWKGLLPVMWGAQLRQERLDELIYQSLFNTSHLPGRGGSPFTPDLYESPTSSAANQVNRISGVLEEINPEMTDYQIPGSAETLVLGAGLAGLTAAWQAAKAGKRVHLLAQGQGSLNLHAGCIDVLGYYPGENTQSLESPAECLGRLFTEFPLHPYTLAGKQRMSDALSAFQELCDLSGYPMKGTLENNWKLPTALGSFRPTCLAPTTMIAGDITQTGSVWVIGFEGYHDFYPTWIAANLEAQGIQSHGFYLELPRIRNRKLVNSRLLADLLDAGEILEEIISAIRNKLKTSLPFFPTRIAFPAVLGLQFPMRVFSELESALNIPVFEIPTLPPSIPGMRLYSILENAIRKLGSRINLGIEITGADIFPDGRIARVWSEASARRLTHSAEIFVLATGGILGGGYTSNSDGELLERIFGLPLEYPSAHQDWFARSFLDPNGHPIFRSGVAVDKHFQPVGPSGRLMHPNLFAAGTALGNCNLITERSFDGVALISGYCIGSQL